MIVGAFNVSEYVDVNQTTLTMNSVSNSTWLFNLTQFGFGFTNTSNGIENATEYYTNFTNATYNQALMTLSHPGIGLAQSQYLTFRNQINAISGNIWTCPNSRGQFCYAPVWCESFNGSPYASYNYTDLSFKIIFNNDTTDYIKIPLMSLMRNSETSTTPRCNILVLEMIPNQQQQYYITLGTAFFQSFFT